MLNYHVQAKIFRNVFPNVPKKGKSNSYSAFSYSGIRSIERDLSKQGGSFTREKLYFFQLVLLR